jgi:dTDP-4-dehydrorhamnose reductase
LNILVLGRGGQLGSALPGALAAAGRVTVLGLPELDLADPAAIRAKVAELRPQVIINAAAYTAVDRAEEEPDVAFAVNATAPGVLAEEAGKLGALLVHFSTDYVFDGTKDAPYVEDDAPNPLGVYGRSKLAGEREVQASGCRHYTFRTSWVYAPGGRNFAAAILAAAREGKPLRVVNDQRGAPTSAAALALAVARILEDPALRKQPSGLYHMSAAGEVTWHGFALEVLAAAGIDARPAAVSSAEYGARVPRPRNSLLDNARLEATFGLRLPHWREGFRALAQAML